MNGPAILAFLLAIALGSCAPPTPTCLTVDGRGTAGYATLDDALADARDGSRICLTAGEFRPPSAAITVAVTIEGVGEDSVISGSADGAHCVDVPSLGGLAADADLAPAPFDAHATILAASAMQPITLRQLAVRGCEVGVVARGAGALLDHVSVSDVDIAVAADGPTALTLTNDTLVADGTVHMASPIGVLAGNGARVLSADTTIKTPSPPSVGIECYRASLDLWSTTIDTATLGLLAVNDDDASHVTLGGGTTVRNLTSSRVGTSVIHAESRIIGGSVWIDGAHFESSDAFGLTLDSTAHATVQNTTFRAIATTSLLLQSRGVVLGGGLDFDVPTGGAGLCLGFIAPPHESATVAATAELRGALNSHGSALVHVIGLAGTSLTISASGSMLSGGQAGIWAQEGAQIAAMGSVSIGDVAQAAVAAFNPSTHVDLADTTVTLPDGALGIAALDGASTSATRVHVTGGAIGLYADSATLQARDSVVLHCGTGVRLAGAAAAGALSGAACEIAMSTDVGARVESGAALTVSGCGVQNNGGAGIEVVDGATAMISGSTFNANAGRGVSFIDASGTVTNSVFFASIPALINGTLRTDEVSVRVTNPAAPRAIQVNGNRFMLDTAPPCGMAQCSVVLADGFGATVETGIVMPNCLRASPADTMRYRGLGEEGGTFPANAPWDLMGATGLLTSDQNVAGLVLASPLPATLVAPRSLTQLSPAALMAARHLLP